MYSWKCFDYLSAEYLLVNAQWMYFINIPVVKEDNLEARNIIALATLKEKKIINKAKVENF